MAQLTSSFMRGFSESYLADLGRVVAAWSHVEMSFDLLFLSLVVMRGARSGSMADPRVPRLMGMPFKRRMRSFRDRLAELDLPSASLAAATNALDQLVSLRNERDAVAHSQFTPAFSKEGQLAEDSAMALYKSWKNLKPHEFSQIPQARLTQVFQRMEELYWALHALTLDPELRAQRQREVGSA